MKFKLKTSGDFYSYEKKAPLEPLGFKFVKWTHGGDERWTKESGANLTVEISSLEALVAFVKQYGSVIFDGETVEIYDDYRE